MQRFDFPIYILRHGETAWNKEGRLQGALDSALTETGRAQAKRQGAILEGLGHLDMAYFCSPLGRTRATADIAAPRARWIEDPRLREMSFGAWDGRTRDEIFLERPDIFEIERGFAIHEHAPGGETIYDMAERLEQFLSRVTTVSVVVTHGVTSRVLRCMLLGKPIEDYAEIGGGQGVVYKICGDEYQKLT